jgi:bifunctional polynucleotide phosphatase/kinase
MWSEHGTLSVYNCVPAGTERIIRKIAGFDLDGTLAKARNGRVFFKDADDWEHMFLDMSKMSELVHKGFYIAVFTNQKWKDKEKLAQAKKRIENIVRSFHVDVQFVTTVLVATGDDHYRKPQVGMFTHVENNFYKNINKKESFYCGDAAGRLNDHSDVDRTFALNCGLQFYTPEEFFLGAKHDPGKLSIDLDEEKRKCKNPAPSLCNPVDKDGKDMVIFVGRPGSGKTHIAKGIFQKEGYAYINADALGSKKKCFSTAEDFLKGKNYRLVVDNTNPSVAARAEWISLAKEYNVPVKILYFDTPEAICKHNNAFRAFKTGQKKVPEIAYRIFNKNLEEPLVEKEQVEQVIKIPFQYDPTVKDWDRYYT